MTDHEPEAVPHGDEVPADADPAPDVPTVTPPTTSGTVDPASPSPSPSPSPPPAPAPSHLRPEAPVLVKVALGTALAALIIAMISLGTKQAAVPTDSGSAAPPATTAVAGPSVTVDVELGEMYVKPSKIEVPQGSSLVLNVSNKGTMDHDLALNGTDGTRLLRPGESQTIDLGPITADAQAWCTVAGHKQAGMVTSIVVVPAAASGTMAGAAPASTATGAGAAAADATIDPAATPAAGFKPYDPTLAPAPSGTHHAVTLEAVDKLIDVAPGVQQLIWTFGGSMPGPVLRGKVGDTFTVTLVNKGTMGHSIDFHAGQRAMDEVMRTIAPGESLTYEFTAEHSGIWMYHCGTPPVLHHIGNGMFGAVIIDPPNLPPVDAEYLFVQSELYLGPQGQPMDFTKMAADAPDAVVFNGYANQYSFAPITVPVNKRIRMWVLDAGPSSPSAFHVIGTQFDTVFKEGGYLVKPGNPEAGGAQVLDLQPGSGGFVEMTFPEAGTYALVSHRFVDANRGASGKIIAR